MSTQFADGLKFFDRPDWREALLSELPEGHRYTGQTCYTWPNGEQIWLSWWIDTDGSQRVERASGVTVEAES